MVTETAENPKLVQEAVTSQNPVVPWGAIENADSPVDGARVRVGPCERPSLARWELALYPNLQLFSFLEWWLSAETASEVQIAPAPGPQWEICHSVRRFPGEPDATPAQSCLPTMLGGPVLSCRSLGSTRQTLGTIP